MKLFKETKTGWQFELFPQVAVFLRVLVDQFPITSATTARISRTDTGPKTAEREALLNESLAEHRADLKRRACRLVAPDKFKRVGKTEVFTLRKEDRETMLQILNDIRIDCWRLLGEPEELDMDIKKLSDERSRWYQFIQVAGFLEHHFLTLDEPPDSDS